MAKKVTTMKLKVDLQCEKCHKKVKKVLGKFPQITDQLYDEKKNIVTIKVVCCSPEKVRDKLCYKGGGSIKSIEIVEPPKLEITKTIPADPKEKEAKKDKPVAEPNTRPPTGEPPNVPATTTPQPVQIAAMFPEPAGVSVLAYPAPAQPVGLFYCGGPGGPIGFYGRPIYDSYGGAMPSYARSHDQNPWEEVESGCTIS